MSVSQIINVVVNSRGAVTVQKQLTAIGDSARTTTSYLNSLRAILTAALAFSGAGAIARVSDEFTALQNRLRQVTDETDTVADSWARLMEIANSSYSTIGSTVDLYFRVAQAYRAWGESAEKAYEFTELFQKAAILSGSTLQTTSQAVYQFGQALNKGKLDGDEFRSVLEGLPYVATLIQKELGVTRAELYKMSKDGKISIDRIKEAFERAAGTIQKDWGKVTPTIGMAIGILQNNWINFIGEIQTSTGIFSVVAQGIILIANNFNLLAIAIAPVAASLVFLAGQAGLGLVINGFRDMGIAIRALIPMIVAMNAALWANPYLIIGAAIVAVIASVIYFRNELGLTNEVLSSIWNTAVQVFGYILTTLNPITALVNYIVQQFGGWAAIWEEIKNLASATGEAIMSMFAAVVSAVDSLVDYLADALAPVFSDLTELASDFFDLIKSLVSLFNDGLMVAIKALEPTFKKIWEYIEPALTKFIKLVQDIFQGWVNIANYLKTNFFPVIKDIFEGWIVIIREVIGFVRDLIAAFKTAIALAAKLGGGGGGGGVAAHNGAQFYAGEFASGGQFRVGGTGVGRDTTPVAFRAERGERVTVETKKQQRQNDNNNGETSVNVPVQINNYFDPQVMVGAMGTRDGVKAIKNAIAVDRDSFREILGVV